MEKADIVPIEITADSIKHSGSNYYYIRHIFNALRAHSELLETPDYRRLYDEASDFLFRHAVEFCYWDERERERYYVYIELLADLSNANSNSEKYSIKEVDLFLTKRRNHWSA